MAYTIATQQMCNSKWWSIALKGKTVATAGGTGFNMFTLDVDAECGLDRHDGAGTTVYPNLAAALESFPGMTITNGMQMLHAANS